MKEQTYKLHIKCTNCNFHSTHPTQMATINLGTTFKKWCKDNKCPTCQCKTLTESSW